MFDNVLIDGEEYKVFFDKKNMKFYIKYSFKKDVKDFIKKNRFIKISNYLLYLTNKVYYNEGNYMYDVLYYVGFKYNDFELKDLKQIIFESKQI